MSDNISNSLSNLEFNAEDEKAIYGVGCYNGIWSETVPLNFAASSTVFDFLSYKWKVACLRKFDNPKKFLISAVKTSRYVFEDQHILTVYLRDNDKELIVKEWSVPFDTVLLSARLWVKDLNYLDSNLATEYNLKDKNRTHDVILVVGKEKFYMLRSYLATWSRFFDRLFYGDFNEKHQKEIKLEEVDAADFERMLRYINPQLSWKLGGHDVLKVLKLADRFEIPNLMARCGEILCDFDKCKDLDVLDRLELADSHNLVHLQIACFERIHKMNEKDRVEFFEKNRRRIQKLSSNVVKNLI